MLQVEKLQCWVCRVSKHPKQCPSLGSWGWGNIKGFLKGTFYGNGAAKGTKSNPPGEKAAAALTRIRNNHSREQSLQEESKMEQDISVCRYI